MWLCVLCDSCKVCDRRDVFDCVCYVIIVRCVTGVTCVTVCVM